MARPKKRKKGQHRLKGWGEFEIRPLQLCLGCGAVIPDLVKVDGRWKRPAPKTYCTDVCANKSRVVGGARWLEKNFPGLDLGLTPEEPKIVKQSPFE